MRPHIKLAKGQTIVVMAMVIAVLVGAMALGVDVGLFYYNWMLLQKAADSAALAGASSLTALADPSGTIAASAVSTAKGYACLNGINDPSNTNTTICPNPVVNASYVDQVAATDVNAADTQLSIRLKRRVPYFFGRALGLNSGDVAASATAQVSEGVGTFKSGMFPIAIQCDQPCNSTASLNPGQSVTFGMTLPGGLSRGNWRWLDLGQGSGSSDVADAIANGVQGTYSIGDNISSTSTANLSYRAVLSGFQSRLNDHSSRFPTVDPSNVCTTGGGNPTNIPLGDPLLVTVPVANFSSGCSGVCTASIEGFAQVYLTNVRSSRRTNTSEIDGCFVQAVAPGSVGSASAPVLGALSPPILVQ